jgi:ubiquinone biosynthesis protein
MYILAKFVSKYPMSKKVRPIEIVAEFESIILNELNMLREAKNATQLRENFQGSDLL